VISTWSWLWVLNPIPISSPHSEGRWIFIDSISKDIVIAWPRSEGFAQGVGFGFRTYGDFGSGFGISEVVVPWAWPLIQFTAVSGCASDSVLIMANFQAGLCLERVLLEL